MASQRLNSGIPAGSARSALRLEVRHPPLREDRRRRPDSRPTEKTFVDLTFIDLNHFETVAGKFDMPVQHVRNIRHKRHPAPAGLTFALAALAAMLWIMLTVDGGERTAAARPPSGTVGWVRTSSSRRVLPLEGRQVLLRGQAVDQVRGDDRRLLRQDRGHRGAIAGAPRASLLGRAMVARRPRMGRPRPRRVARTGRRFDSRLLQHDRGCSGSTGCAHECDSPLSSQHAPHGIAGLVLWWMRRWTGWRANSA